MSAMIRGAGKVWHSGPPPHIGWWPASVSRAPDALRWWDGEMWSCAAFEGFCPTDAALFARIRRRSSSQVEWRNRPEAWP